MSDAATRSAIWFAAALGITGMGAALILSAVPAWLLPVGWVLLYVGTMSMGVAANIWFDRNHHAALPPPPQQQPNEGSPKATHPESDGRSLSAVEELARRKELASELAAAMELRTADPLAGMGPTMSLPAAEGLVAATIDVMRTQHAPTPQPQPVEQLPQKPQLNPNLKFVRGRMVDVWISVNSGSRIFSSYHDATRHTGALVLVFSNDPGPNVCLAGHVHAQMTVDGLRVPVAYWLGYSETAYFTIGGVHELVLAVKQSGSESFLVAEMRPGPNDETPMHYEPMKSKCSVSVRLFNNGGYVVDFEFDVDVEANPPSVIRRVR